MNHRLLIGAACAAFALSSVSVQAQSCGEDCPPPCFECGPPTPPPPPQLPNAPKGNGNPSAAFFAASSEGFVEGGTAYNTGIPRVFTFGGGQGVPFTDTLFQFGTPGANISFQTDHTNASVLATAHDGNIHGRTDAYVSLGYVVTLTAATSSVADQIQAILMHSPLAAAQGSYTLSASGSGLARASASSSFGPNGSAGNAYGFHAQCNDSSLLGGCGTSGWTINLGFKRGTAFADGDANTFYGSFSFTADVAAGSPGLGVYPGDASAYVDPNILFNQQLSQFGNQIGYNVGNGGLGNGGFTALAGNVPEPASWALMLGGFGLLGGAVRRRRVTFAAA